MPEKDLFKEKFAALQEEAASQEIRLIQVPKGKKRTSFSTDGSTGKQLKGISKKRLKGKGVYYDEPKKRMSISLTDDMRKELTALANEADLSCSETIERCLRVIHKYPKIKPLILEYLEEISDATNLNINS